MQNSSPLRRGFRFDPAVKKIEVLDRFFSKYILKICRTSELQDSFLVFSLPTRVEVLLVSKSKDSETRRPFTKKGLLFLRVLIFDISAIQQ